MAVAAAGLALCVLVVVAFVLVRPDNGGVALPPGPVATGDVDPGAGGDGADAPPPGSPDAGAGTGTSGSGSTVADGPADPPEVSGAADDGRVGGPTLPGTSTTAGTDTGTGTGADPDPGTGTGTTAAPTPSSPDPSSTEPATAPWVTDCTYYSGNGQTALGDEGKKVSQAQCILAKRGYDIGPSGVDGYFGESTEAAVRAFQADKGLDDDGIVGKDTWGALRSAE